MGLDALWFGLVHSRRRVEEVCGVLGYQEIRLVVGSPGRATGDITFVEDAGMEREGCLARFLGQVAYRESSGYRVYTTSGPTDPLGPRPCPGHCP